MPVAPKGTKQVHFTGGTISQANEAAMSIALLKYAKDNKKDASKLTILGFENNYHGDSIGALSCSDESTNMKNLPTFDWPRAPFPKI